MSDIPRYRMTNSFGYQDNENGLWVRHADHVKWADELEDSHEAEIKLMRLILEPTPEPKFKVGDRVQNDMFIGTVTSIETYEDQEDEFWVAWDKGGQSQCDSRTLTLYVPPTPAKLIPTLKEHEWVRGTYKTGTAFGPCTTYYNEIGAMFAGDNNLVHWNSGAISDELATIERCDAPKVE